MKTFRLMLILLGISLTVNAEVLTAMRDSVPGSYNFWLYAPRYWIATKACSRSAIKSFTSSRPIERRMVSEWISANS